MKMYFKIKVRWIQLFSLASWITTMIGTLFIKPPSISVYDRTDYDNICRLVIAVLLGLGYIMMAKYQLKKHYKGWLAAGYLATVLSIITAIIYFIYMDAWSVDFYGKRLVIGEHSKISLISQQNLAASLNLKEIDNETLVKTYAGNTKEIWPHQELRNHYILIVITYILLILFMASLLMMIAHAINCYESKVR